LCWFVFGYNLLSLGIWFIPFILNMILSGVVCGIVLISFLIRFGQSAEWFGWMLGWSFIPFMGVYYPVDILPQTMQAVSVILPPTYIFDGLRQIALGQPVHENGLYIALALNLVYGAIAIMIYFHTLAQARKRGNLLSLNE
jgi:ABC-2 type transport system permease protein